jgi:hypothetical protein
MCGFRFMQCNDLGAVHVTQGNKRECRAERKGLGSLSRVEIRA